MLSKAFEHFMGIYPPWLVPKKIQELIDRMLNSLSNETILSKVPNSETNLRLKYSSCLISVNSFSLT